MRTWLRTAAAALLVVFYSGFAPLGYLAFMLLALVPTTKPERRARFLQWVMRRVFIAMHAVIRQLRLLHYDPRAPAGVSLPAGPAVLVVNHPTLIDVIAIMATIDNVTTAVKPSIFNRWTFRPLLAGALQFEGGTARAAFGAHVVESSIDRLNRGFRVLMFSEGTRSPEYGLHPFGRTAFEVACKANVPVIPIVLRCEPPWLTKEHGIFDPPSVVPRLSLEVLMPVLPSDHGGSSRKLRDVVHARFRDQLGLSVAGRD